jgi:transcription elongation factor GreB
MGRHGATWGRRWVPGGDMGTEVGSRLPRGAGMGDGGRAMANLRPMTPQGFETIRKEMEQLWRVERPKVVQEVSDAAAQGDRSENAEYIYGKRRLREIDRRLGYLNRILEQVQVVDPKDLASDRVKFGATVTVEDEDGGQKTYQLVGRDESDAKQGRISIESPIGKALLNRQVGDSVLVRRPAGEVELLLVALDYR